MKKTELLFPTPIWTDDDVGLDLKPIQDFSYEVRDHDPQGRQATNDGGWQSNEFKFCLFTHQTRPTINWV